MIRTLKTGSMYTKAKSPTGKLHKRWDMTINQQMRPYQNSARISLVKRYCASGATFVAQLTIKQGSELPCFTFTYFVFIACNSVRRVQPFSDSTSLDPAASM